MTQPPSPVQPLPSATTPSVALTASTPSVAATPQPPATPGLSVRGDSRAATPAVNLGPQLETPTAARLKLPQLGKANPTSATGSGGSTPAPDRAEISALDRAGYSPKRVSRKVMDDYNPDSQWFDGRYFYPQQSAPGYSTVGVMRKNAAAVLALQEDDEAADTRTLFAEVSKREHNLSSVHHTLFPRTTLLNGTICLSTSEWMSFIQTLSTTGHDTSPAKAWFESLGVLDGQYVGYEDLLRALDRLFNGEMAEEVCDVCFALCDTGKNGYILMDNFKRLRDNELAPDNADIDCMVVMGVMRAFDRVGKIEEETVRAAFLKKNRKLRKKKNLVIPMPSKRQFHINPDEFRDFMKKDAYLVLSFLPYVLKTVMKNIAKELAMPTAFKVAPPDSDAANSTPRTVTPRTTGTPVAPTPDSA